MTILATTSLTKKYKDFIALDGVSIHVEKGDIYGLIGRNGAGKTTLFKLIMGLSERTSGEILIQNESDIHRARKSIGFLIGLSFFPYLNARENIEFYRKLKGIADKSETDRVLKLVKLENVKKPFKSFSLGMKQRLGIANALLGNPAIVILDEPINGLDPQGIIEIRKMIERMNHENGTTFIISSHILSELDMVATKFGFIEEGKLLSEITHQDLHQMMNTSLLIEVNDIKKAIQLLEKHLKIKKHHLNEKNQIILEEYIEKPEIISKLLISEGLELFAIGKQETTLEEYFISLIHHQHV